MHFRDWHIKEEVSLVITQVSRAYGTRVYDYKRKPTKALTAFKVRQKPIIKLSRLELLQL